ncbi:phosphopantetheine-binding protein [Marinobacter fonticola]|uniref:phosphopantetheine-binding protein n=1 Tax=Marinobacter fonticola TaxID=2603215 RepID=UPI0011E76E84|nr:phosphopantetheine-binding protein [Marinobacter fonticola]
MIQYSVKDPEFRAEVVGAIAGALEKRGPLPQKGDLEDYEYLPAGHVDSLSLLGFITELEERFDVEFDDDDFESERFQTVGGLANLILEKRLG